MHTYTIGLDSQIPRLSESQTDRFFQILHLSQNLREPPRLLNIQTTRLRSWDSLTQTLRFADSQTLRMRDFISMHTYTVGFLLSDSQALRFSDSQGLRYSSIPLTLRRSESFRFPLILSDPSRSSQILLTSFRFSQTFSDFRFSQPDFQILTFSDSWISMLSDYQILRVSDSQTLRLSQSLFLRHSDSQTLRLSDSLILRLP